MVPFLIINSCYFNPKRPKDLDFMIILVLGGLSDSCTELQTYKSIIISFVFIFVCVYFLCGFSTDFLKISQS